MEYQEKVKRIATLALDYKIVSLNFADPTTFKSGILSPIYCDFRKCLQYPELMDLIEQAFCYLIPQGGTHVIAGVATGAIAHAAGIAKMLKWPLCYVRPGSKPKEYGLGKHIEGADVTGHRIYLIEDLVSTGESIASDAAILKLAGAKRIVPLSIFTYEMKQSKKTFKKAKLEEPCSLITFTELLPLIKDRISENDYKSLIRWKKNPEAWTPTAPKK